MESVSRQDQGNIFKVRDRVDIQSSDSMQAKLTGKTHKYKKIMDRYKHKSESQYNESTLSPTQKINNTVHSKKDSSISLSQLKDNILKSLEYFKIDQRNTTTKKSNIFHSRSGLIATSTQHLHQQLIKFPLTIKPDNKVPIIYPLKNKSFSQTIPPEIPENIFGKKSQTRLQDVNPDKAYFHELKGQVKTVRKDDQSNPWMFNKKKNQQNPDNNCQRDSLHSKRRKSEQFKLLNEETAQFCLYEYNKTNMPKKISKYTKFSDRLSQPNSAKGSTKILNSSINIGPIPELTKKNFEATKSSTRLKPIIGQSELPKSLKIDLSLQHGKSFENARLQKYQNKKSKTELDDPLNQKPKILFNENFNSNENEPANSNYLQPYDLLSTNDSYGVPVSLKLTSREKSLLFQKKSTTNDTKTYKVRSSLIGLESVLINTSKSAFSQKSLFLHDKNNTQKFPAEKKHSTKTVVVNTKPKMFPDPEILQLESEKNYLGIENSPVKLSNTQKTSRRQIKTKALKKTGKGFVVVEDDIGETKKINSSTDCVWRTRKALGSFVSLFGYQPLDMRFEEHPWVNDCRALSINLYENLHDFYSIFKQNYSVLCKRLQQIISEVSMDPDSTLYDLLLGDYQLALPFCVFSVEYIFNSMILAKKNFAKKKVSIMSVATLGTQGFVPTQFTRQHNKEYLRKEDETYKQYMGRLAQIERTKNVEAERVQMYKVCIKNRDFGICTVNLKNKEDITMFIKNMCNWMAAYKERNCLNTLNNGYKTRQEIANKQNQVKLIIGKKRMMKIEMFHGNDDLLENDGVGIGTGTGTSNGRDLVRMYEDHEYVNGVKQDLSEYQRNLNRCMRSVTNRIDKLDDFN